MPEEISPENELQQNLEQLNIVDNDGDVDDNLREYEEEELISNDQGQDRKPTSDNDNDNKDNEKKQNDETTCRPEDGGHEIETNITNNNDNDKDATSSADESDFSLPKHRKDCPSDDERTDSESLSNEEEEEEEEEELGSEESDDHLNSPQVFPSLSKVPYEQVTPNKPSNDLQVNGVMPFEISPMSLGDGTSQVDADVAKIVNPIMRCIADLKSDFRTQLAKFHYYTDPSLDEVKVDENWQHTEFESSQDQHCYDAIVTAGKLLDVIMPLQLPEEAKERLSQARHILWEKALLCRISSSTENINISSSSNPQAADLAIVDSTPDNSVDSSVELVSSNAKNNNKSSEENRSVQGGGDSNSKAQGKVVDGTTTANNESNNISNPTTSRKYQRDSTQGRKLRRHLPRGASAYSPKSVRRNQNYSPRTSNVRSPRIGSTVTSSIAGPANNVLQTNNRRFVGFLPSRCFTCGGIGHFATNCPNKGSYIAANTGNNQHLSRRKRSSVNRYRRTTESVGNNSTSNE